MPLGKFNQAIQTTVCERRPWPSWALTCFLGLAAGLVSCGDEPPDPPGSSRRVHRGSQSPRRPRTRSPRWGRAGWPGRSSQRCIRPASGSLNPWGGQSRASTRTTGVLPKNVGAPGRCEEDGPAGPSVAVLAKPGLTAAWACRGRARTNRATSARVFIEATATEGA